MGKLIEQIDSTSIKEKLGINEDNNILSSFTDKYENITTSNVGAWVERTTLSDNNSIIQVLIKNNSNQNRVIGVRSVNSTINKLVTLSKKSCVTMIVHLDSTSKLEIYSNGSNVEFINIGELK